MFVCAVVLSGAAIAFAHCFRLAARVAFRGDALKLLLTMLRAPRDALEVRGAPLAAPSDADCATMTRALATGRIMLLSFVVTDGGADVRALGESGHVYSIVLRAAPTCSCPAFAYRRDAQCKHLAWLKTKVLGAPPDHYIVYQRAYLRLELAYLLRAPAASALYAPRPIREALGIIQPTIIPADDSVCAVCYDELETSAATLRCAAQCRKVFHHECVRQYHASLAADGKPLVCACCRAPWLDAVAVETVVTRDFTYTHVSHPHGATPKKQRASSVRRL